jgi:hypothetical protein
MKKPKNSNNKSHKRALKASKRKKAFAKLKHLWSLGIGLYETESKKERNQSN